MPTRGARIYLSHRIQETKQLENGEWQWEKCEEMECPRCGKMHDSLWTIRRVLVDTMGHFPVFRINGEEHVPDMSLPHHVDRLPRDAKKIESEEFARLWHMNTGSHTFGA